MARRLGAEDPPEPAPVHVPPRDRRAVVVGPPTHPDLVDTAGSRHVRPTRKGNGGGRDGDRGAAVRPTTRLVTRPHPHRVPAGILVRPAIVRRRHREIRAERPHRHPPRRDRRPGAISPPRRRHLVHTAGGRHLRATRHHHRIGDGDRGAAVRPTTRLVTRPHPHRVPAGILVRPAIVRRRHREIRAERPHRHPPRRDRRPGAISPPHSPRSR